MKRGLRLHLVVVVKIVEKSENEGNAVFVSGLILLVSFEKKCGD